MRRKLLDEDVSRIGTSLSAARRQGVSASGLQLQRIGTLEEAYLVERVATSAFGDPEIGHAVAASSDVTGRLLRCEDPIVGPIFARDRLSSGDTLTVRPSMLGIGAQIAFVFGASYVPEMAKRSNISDAIASCRVSLQVLERRVPHSTPLNERTASADFGLASAYVQGPTVSDWRKTLSSDISVNLEIDGNVNGRGHLGDLMGHPLDVVAWLVRRLAVRGRYIEAGDVVSTGSCTGLVQLTPGRTIVGNFGNLGSLTLHVI